MNLYELKGNSIDKTIYLERYVNNGSPSGYTHINNTSLGTRAFDQQEYIKVSLFSFPNEKIAFQIGDAETDVTSINQMIVHPDLSEYVKNNSDACLIGTIDAVPLASGRTVYVPIYDVFVKLQYNNLLGRTKRYIDQKKATHAIAVNEIFAVFFEKEKGRYYYPETFSKAFFLENNETIGMIIRTKEVVPFINEAYISIPGFSLFSKDINSPNDESILAQLLRVVLVRKEDYILEKLIYPAIELYFDVLLKTGLQIEAHAQNICYIYSNDIIGIAIRDFESIDKDLEIAKEYNGLFNHDYKCFDRAFFDYQKRHSFMFDFKLGEYLITPIIETAAVAGCNKQYLVQATKDFSLQFIKQLPEDFFPDGKWYSLPNTLIDRTTSKRPYVEHLYPKYR